MGLRGDGKTGKLHPYTKLPHFHLGCGFRLAAGQIVALTCVESCACPELIWSLLELRECSITKVELAVSPGNQGCASLQSLKVGHFSCGAIYSTSVRLRMVTVNAMISPPDQLSTVSCLF